MYWIWRGDGDVVARLRWGDEERGPKRVPQDIDPRVDATTVREWSHRYVEDRESEDLAPNTMLSVRAGMAKWRDSPLAARMLGSLTFEDGVSYRRWLRDLRGPRGAPLAKITVVKHLGQAKAALEHAQNVFRGYANPWRNLPSGQPRVRPDVVYVPMADFDRLLAASHHHGMRVLLSLCRLAGLRKGEAERLRWHDVDLPGRVLHVIPKGGERTTKARQRVVPIRTRLLAELEEAKRLGHERPFKSPVKQTGNGAFYERHLLPIYERAKVEHSKPLHGLRASAERDWINEGLPPTDVYDWLGHSESVARQNYLRIDPDQLRRGAHM